MLTSLLLFLPYGLILVGVRANHSTCSRGPLARAPWYDDYRLWCEAGRVDTAADQAEYRCNDQKDVMIADFGKLRPGVLEWGESAPV